MGNGNGPSDKSLPVLRYAANDDSSSPEELLEEFRKSNLAEGITAENQQEFARKAQERVLQTLSEKGGTSMPALRVMGGFGEDVPDDTVWNNFQQSGIAKRINPKDAQEAERFARQQLMSNVGLSSQEQETTQPTQAQDREPVSLEESSLPNSRLLLNDNRSTDQELVQEFQESEYYDPESDLDPQTQAELFAKKKLYTKVNNQIQNEGGTVGSQKNIAFDKTEQDESWTQWFLDLEESISSDVLDEPVQTISRALGNEDVETGEGVLDYAARILDVPGRITEFAREEVARTAGVTADLAELAGEEISEADIFDDEVSPPPKEAFNDTDLADVPGLEEAAPAEKLINEETGEPRPADDLIKMAVQEEDVSDKRALFKAATMQRRKERFDNMSFEESFARSGKLMGRAAMDAVLGIPRQVSALREEVEEQVRPGDDRTELSDNALAHMANSTEKMVKNWLPVRDDVKGGFWWDTVPQATGSMAAFMGTGALAGTVARSSAAARGALGGTLRRGIDVEDVARPGARGQVDDFQDFVRQADSDEIRETLGDQSLTAQRLRGVDEMTQRTTGAGVATPSSGRQLVAKNAQDVEQALTVGGNPLFAASGELGSVGRAQRVAGRLTPAIQGGGMTGWNAYKRFKQNPDPRMLEGEARDLLERSQAGESLTEEEQRELDAAIEEQSMNAFWTSAPGGWTEAVAGRFVDNILAVPGKTPGFSIATMKGGASEFVQETFQSSFDDAAQQFTTDPELEPFQNTLEEGFAGAIAGALMGGMSSAIGNHRAHGEQIGRLEESNNKVPRENLGRKRAGEHQAQLTEERNRTGESQLSGASYARTLTDMDEDGGASRIFPLDRRQSESVRRLVSDQDISEGTLEQYAEDPELRRQDRVGRAISAVIDAQESLSDEQQQLLKDRFMFHDVRGRALRADEIDAIDVAEDGDHWAGLTESDRFVEGRFGQTHIFANASETDAFEELFHTLYDFGGEDAQQRAVEAYNQTEGENIESYEQNREKIARRFAEEINNQADIEAPNTIEAARQMLSSVAQSLSPDNPIQQEVGDLLSGQADFEWGSPIDQENSTVVIQNPSRTFINPSQGEQVIIPGGIYGTTEADRQTIREEVDRVEQDEDADLVYALRPATQPAATGESIDSMLEEQEKMRADYRSSIEVVEQEVQQEIDEAQGESSGAVQARVAAQTTETSRGLPDLPDQVTRQELKSLGFRHENHAVNAVNKERRESNQDEYGEGDTVPVSEVQEAARTSDRISRRVQETGQVPDAFETDVSPPSGLRNLQTEEDIQRFESSLRQSVRDGEVRTGEQDMIRAATRKIRAYKQEADSYREQADEASEAAREAALIENARKAERATNAIAMGLNERFARREQPEPTEQQETPQVERSGTPQAFPSNARIPTWAESRYVPRFSQTFVWDPSQPDPTGLRDFFERLPSVATQVGEQQAQTEEGLPDVQGGNAQVIEGTGGETIRTTQTETFESVDGTQYELAKVAEQDANRVPARLQAPIDQLAEGREGTWVQQDFLEPAESFVQRQQTEQQRAIDQNRQSAANQAAEQERRVREQVQQMSRQQTEDLPDVDPSEIDRVDPTDVQERSPIEQAIFLSQRARDDVFAGNMQEARRKLVNARQIVSENDIDIEFGTEGPSSTNDTPAKQFLANSYDQTRDLIERGVPEVDVSDQQLEIESQEELNQRLVDLGINPDEADATSRLFDARAEAFKNRTGLPKSVWYKSRIAGFTREDLSDEALNQIRAFHGSPYWFSNFDTQHIGEGEGNQMFGWGLYFTGSEQVARHNYADKLSQLKGRAEWEVLGGRYTIRREAGSPTMEIVGPEGEVIGTVDQQDRLAGLQTAGDRLVSALEDARKIVAEDAIDRGIEEAPETLGLVEQRHREALEAERARFDAQARLTNTPEFQRALERIRAQVNGVIDGTDGISEQALEFDILADLQRVSAEQFGSIFQPAWESDLALTLETEFGVSRPEVRELIEFLSGNLEGRLREVAEEVGYTQAREREVEAASRYEAARREFRTEIDVELSDLDRVLFDVMLHEGREPSEYEYARWRDTPSDEQWDAIQGAINDLADEGVFEGNVRPADMETDQDAGVSENILPAISMLREGNQNLVTRLVFGTEGDPQFGDVYEAIVGWTEASQKQLSQALLANGIDGVVFRGKGGQADYDNYVVFDDSVVSVQSTEMFQQRAGNITGAIDFMSDGRARVQLTESADADTVVEEMGHLLLEDMPFEDRRIVAEALRGELGNQNITAHNLREITEAHEQFADWFRRYVREGVASSTTLERIFEDMKQIMSRIWESLGGTAFVEDRVPSDVRATMDRLFLPDDPRSVRQERTQDPTETLEDTDTPGLRRDSDGNRVFYPQAYKNYVMEGGEEVHADLTPEEFAAYRELVPPSANEAANPHREATFQALRENRPVPNASIEEHLSGAPEPILERFGLEESDLSDLETEQADIREGVPDDQMEAQVENESSVSEEGDVVRNIDPNTQEGQRTLELVAAGRERHLEEVQKGKHFISGVTEPEYVTPAMVQTRYEAALTGNSAQQYQELEEAIESDRFMNAEERRAFMEREQSMEESNTQDQRERFDDTTDKINDVMGADTPHTTLESALASVTNNVVRNFEQARELYRQYQVARKQDDYPTTNDERTRAQIRFRESANEAAQIDAVPEETVEALQETDPGDAPTLISEDQRAKKERARDPDLSWQEQGREFDPVEWFNEFWIAQSSRSQADVPVLVQRVEELQSDFFDSSGQITEKFGTNDGRARKEASNMWKSMSMKQGVNGGLLYSENGDQNPALFSEGINKRAVLVTPEFVIELSAKENSQVYEMTMREPTDEELNLTENQKDRLAWESRSRDDASAMTELTSDYHNDTFVEDEGEYSVEEKMDVFAAKRPSYDLAGDGVLVERAAHGGRSSADKARFSLIAPEAQGPVAVFRDGDEVSFATKSDELEQQLIDKYGERVKDRIDRIDDDGPDLFGDEDVVSTETIQGRTQEYVEGLREMLGIDNRIAVVHPDDIDPDNPGEFTGDHRSGRLIPHDALNEMEAAPTWVGDFGNGDYYLVVRDEGMTSEAYKSEAIAHEIGHIVFQERLNSEEHAEARSRLEQEHVQSIDLDRTVEEHIEEFMSYHRLRASDYIDSVGDMTMEELMHKNPRMFEYLTSFDEWVAEQTARYVTTEDAVGAGDSVVRRFYNEIARYFKNIYRFLMENGFGPNVRFAEWMDHHVERKETSDRWQQTELVRKSRPYQSEVQARRNIEAARESVPGNVLEDIREAVRGDEDIELIVSDLPAAQQEAASKYARAFDETIRAQDRDYPDSSFQVDASYATSAPTPALQDERLSETIRRSIRESLPNHIRRKYYTPVHRHVRILGEKYPVLQKIADEVFAAPDDRPDSETFTEAVRRRRNEYLPQLADIFRRVSNLDIRPREGGQFAQSWLGRNIPDWLKKSGRIGQLMEVLRDPEIDATSEQAVRQAVGDEVVAREAVRLRELMDDFFDYLVEKNALPESARLENYFPADMKVDEVVANPQAFENMLFEQMRRQAAENQGVDPQNFAFDTETKNQVQHVAHQIRQGITQQNGDEHWGQAMDFMKEQNERFSRLIGATPESLKHRYLRFLDHNDPQVRRFYEQDPVAILERYFSGNIRYAEFADRFGANGELVDAAVDVLNDAGAPDHVAERLQGFMASVRGTYAGHGGRSWQEKQKGRSKSAKSWKVADTAVDWIRNFVTFQLMQAVGVASTLPETMAIPVRTGFLNSALELPGAIWEWVQEGMSESKVRVLQRLGVDAERSRNSFRRMMMDSGALADRTVDEVIRSRIRAGGGVQGRLMKWFFNANLLRPITRLQRTWASKAGHRHIMDALKNAEQSPRLMRELERLSLPTDPQERAEMLDIVERMRAGEEGVWGTEKADQYLNAMARLAQQTVVEGEAASRPLWMSSKHPLFRLHGQFKSFAAAYREGPLAYMSDETIQNDTDSLQQSARMMVGLLAMGAAAGVADWIRWSLYYDMGDPEQREIKRDMVNNLEFGESLEALQNGEFGRAARQVSGLPRIIERTGVPGTATFGTYYPITSVREYDANLLVQLLGPGPSQATNFSMSIANSNYQQAQDFLLRAMPGGQAMRYREQYKRWWENGAPMPWAEPERLEFLEESNGTNEQ